MNSVRTCLGCRVRTDKSALLRVVARNGEVISDPSETLPGRGAWVHPTRECVEKSIARRAIGRALRVSVPLDAASLLARVGEPQNSRITEQSGFESSNSSNEMAD